MQLYCKQRTFLLNTFFIFKHKIYLRATFSIQSLFDSAIMENKMQPVSGTFYDEKEKTWYGPKRKDLYNSELTVGEVALMQLRKNPRKIIQIFDPTGETLTAQEIADYGINVARNLMSLNLQPRDVIGLYARNSFHLSTLVLASFLVGTPVNALFPGFDVENVSLIFNNTRPKIIFCDAENYENAKEANENLDLNALIYLMTGEKVGVKNIEELLEYEEQLTNNEFRLPCWDMKGEDIACIMCSSGTTGIPKGVMTSHYALLQKEALPNTTTDSVVFTFSTMYWASGVLTLITSLCNCVTRIVTDSPYTPEYFLYLVERYEITHFIGGSFQMAELIFSTEDWKIRKALRSIDSILCGGSKVPDTIQSKMFEILSDNINRPGFCVAYGMSELNGWVSISGHPPYEFCEFSEGKLAPNEKMRIVDKQGNLKGPNEEGEICACSPYRFVGYYKNPKATKETLKDNWISSGDLGYFDDKGFLHVCGREKEVFKSFNFQIYPQEIEENIMKIPGVKEVCIVGIPDFVGGNLIACAVVRSKDETGLDVTAESIDRYVKENMSNIYHLKGGVYFLESLPKTGSGKVQRKPVLDLIQNGLNM